MPRAAATLAFACAFALAGPAEADVEITAAGDRLDVSASGVPVSEVLAGLARRTRMKVVYEGTVPRAPVTVDLRGRTPAEAVLGVLEGLGLDYALVMDLSGTEVETLMIVGAGARSSTAGAPGPARSPRAAPPPDPENEVEYVEQVEEERRGTEHVVLDVPKAEDEAKPAPVGPVNPSSAFPVSPFAPAAPLPTPVPAPTPSPNVNPNPPSGE
jgi:hypothetical protein